MRHPPTLETAKDGDPGIDFELDVKPGEYGSNQCAAGRAVAAEEWKAIQGFKLLVRLDSDCKSARKPNAI